MERYSTRKIDGLGKILLHKELRKKLGLERKGEIALIPIGNIVILQKLYEEEPVVQHDYGFVSTIDDVGAFELCIELRDIMRWKMGDDITVYYVDDTMVILKGCVKYSNSVSRSAPDCVMRYPEHHNKQNE